MSIRRVVPNIRVTQPEESLEFYRDFLGFDVAMDMGWVVTFASPSNKTAQVTLLKDEESGVPHPDLSIEVGDVDAVHADAVARGLPIVYPLTEEPWGVRRFFVCDPNGAVLNVVSHNGSAAR